MTVAGVSALGALGPGIGNLEASWYHSGDDEDGTDPFVRNSQLRFLAGYEVETATNVTVGVQYYLERLLDYNAYRANLPAGFPARDENRQWATLDLTWELMAQNQLVLSLFSFYSLSGGDAYLRPKAAYDYSDNWQVQVGANLFWGDRETFFGRFEKNSNLYAGLRYSF